MKIPKFRCSKSTLHQSYAALSGEYSIHNIPLNAKIINCSKVCYYIKCIVQSKFDCAIYGRLF